MSIAIQYDINDINDNNNNNDINDINDNNNIKNLLLELAVKKKHKRNEIINKIVDKNNISPDVYCNDCKTFNIKEFDGYYTCYDCGLKLEHIIDCGQEWTYYNNDDNKGADPSRCDMPINELLPISSMGTFIGYGGKETATSKRIRNMSRWYAMPYKESTLLETFNNITTMAHNSGLNHCIIDEAKYMYKKISEIKSSRRTKKEGMKAGSIAMACKIKGVPRNCAEIAKICHMENNKTLRKSIKTFEEIWNNIKMRENNIINTMRFYQLLFP